MSPDRPHLESLDVFRGVTIAAMILVNNPGDWNTVYPALVHSDWNGLTAADVVFPFFVFIMGCAMPFAFARRRQEPERPHGWGRIVRRLVTLVALGLVLNLAATPAGGAVRIPGVLQRLGLAYFFAAVIVRTLGVPAQAAVAAALALGHWALLTLVPFGGHAIPLLLTRGHNLAGYLDARVFGSHTLTPGFDPEGLLGTLPTVSTALAGALAGRWLRRQGGLRRQLTGLAAAGAAAIGVGLVWARAWPINKPLWSGSYALVTAGLASLALAACVYVVDVRGVRRWTAPVHALGVNPLAIYFGSELAGHLIERPLLPAALGGTTPKDWIFWHAVVPLTGDASGELASLVFAAAFVLCWTGVAVALDRRHVRLRV
jgi:predicted acyltransferase